jgi:hypothetical protein
VFVAIFVDEIAAVQHSGGTELMRAKLLALTEVERQVLRDALLDSTPPDRSDSASGWS